MTKPLRIGVDIGGVVSKFPGVFKPLLIALHFAAAVEVWFVSDMHPVQKIVDMLNMNGVPFFPERVRSADYKTHGEMCKAIVCEREGIDILIDDFPGYVATVGKPPVRLLVMPDPREPYYADDWKTDGSEGNFGRRNPPGSKRPPEDRNPQTGCIGSNKEA